MCALLTSRCATCPACLPRRHPGDQCQADFTDENVVVGWQATKKVVDKLYGAGVRRFFIMGAPPLHDAPTMRVMAPSPAASDLGRLAAFGLQTSLDAQSQVLPFEGSYPRLGCRRRWTRSRRCSLARRLISTGHAHWRFLRRNVLAMSCRGVQAAWHRPWPPVSVGAPGPVGCADASLARSCTECQRKPLVQHWTASLILPSAAPAESCYFVGAHCTLAQPSEYPSPGIMRSKT